MSPVDLSEHPEKEPVSLSRPAERARKSGSCLPDKETVTGRAKKSPLLQPKAIELPVQ